MTTHYYYIIIITLLSTCLCQQQQQPTTTVNSITFNCSKPLESTPSQSSQSQSTITNQSQTITKTTSKAIHSNYSVCPNELYWGKEVIIIHFYYSTISSSSSSSGSSSSVTSSSTTTTTKRPRTANLLLSQGNLTTQLTTTEQQQQNTSIIQSQLLYSSPTPMNWSISPFDNNIWVLDVVLDPRIINTNNLMPQSASWTNTTTTTTNTTIIPALLKTFVLNMKLVVFDFLTLPPSAALNTSSLNVTTLHILNMVILPENTNMEKPNATGTDALSATVTVLAARGTGSATATPNHATRDYIGGDGRLFGWVLLIVSALFL